jgi:hypothetical protein
MLAEVAEHLIGLSSHAVTLHAPGLPEEQQRAPFLARGESMTLAAGEAVEWRIGKDEGELKFGNRLAKVLEANRATCGDLWERLAEELPILVAGVQPAQHCVAHIVITTGEVKSGYLDTLCRRDERLGHKQVWQGQVGKDIPYYRCRLHAI